MNSKKHHFNQLHSFDLDIRYMELDSNAPNNVHHSHIHEECEIYINLSGDISFMVENKIYPIKPGDVIITRPYEYHHCVYHSNKIHKHFWILFSATGNEDIFDIFFDRKLGEGNHLVLPPQNTEELVSLCRHMTTPDSSQIRNYCNFFRLINLLQNADTPHYPEDSYPSDINFAVNYINQNFDQPMSIADIARKSCVSVNTLERHFLTFLNTSPSAYIRKKRLANAAMLLSLGHSVTAASEKSGFSDYSAFIALFRKTYGITPLRYSKNVQKNPR